jgi:bifunctional DNA-binding transcriptional regulator/antitoxin component of YhaV-PrlF toxin-antitoxin module
MHSIISYNAFTDEHYITLPDDIVELLDLCAGDTLEWVIQDNKVYIKNKRLVNDEKL